MFNQANAVQPFIIHVLGGKHENLRQETWIWPLAGDEPQNSWILAFEIKFGMNISVPDSINNSVLSWIPNVVKKNSGSML